MMRSCIAVLAFFFIISSISYNPDAFPAPELIDELSQASSDESGEDNQAPQVLGDPTDAVGSGSGDQDKPLVVSDPLDDDIGEVPVEISGEETNSENFVPQVMSDPVFAVGHGNDVAKEDPTLISEEPSSGESAEPVAVGDPVYIVEEGSGDANGDKPAADGNDVPFEIVASGDNSNENSKDKSSVENSVPEIAVDPPFSVGEGSGDSDGEIPEPVAIGDPVYIVEEGSGDANGDKPAADGNDVPFEIVESGDNSNENSKEKSSDENSVPEIAVDPPFSVGLGSGDSDGEIPVTF